MDFVSLPLALEHVNEEQDRGVLYISRIPPKMTPGILRELLTPYGKLSRIFLTPKQEHSTKKRQSRVDDRKKPFHGSGFVEGWIEFTYKKDAKRAAEILNCNPIGRTGRSKRFADDLWNLKYLSKFTWSHLTDQLAYKKAVREQRLNAEISQSKKTNQLYLQKAEKARTIDAMERKRAQKQPAATEPTPNDTAQSTSSLISQISKRFRQRKPILCTDDGDNKT
ncbi:hypothetical protein MDAP_000964 [Mitosporidium daphniae]|uniref:18S rRNA factor 2 n=1 Tax=Mitosporidium daphniae TaxID=1485682 RepID=A0A098VV41_9MICR|nr:uncharacterized protein DI09_132p50 [Mitosporidium daphniae]KGG52812.1 hypothetical protein DI09_132p50 [Mitosporidium daphniae]|eukprot:XP_013239248.1 uncharacterized protein DI09_132p50 [Mitosporidium daphniae]